MSKLTLDGVDVMGERLTKEVSTYLIMTLFKLSEPKKFITFNMRASIAYSDLLLTKMFECQVLDVIQEKPNLRKISFVAHSVGGLVARYAIGRLYRPPKEEDKEDMSGNGCKEEPRGTIGGLEAMNFITVATPHLGSRGNKQVAFLY